MENEFPESGMERFIKPSGGPIKECQRPVHCSIRLVERTRKTWEVVGAISEILHSRAEIVLVASQLKPEALLRVGKLTPSRLVIAETRDLVSYDVHG